MPSAASFLRSDGPRCKVVVAIDSTSADGTRRVPATFRRRRHKGYRRRKRERGGRMSRLVFDALNEADTARLGAALAAVLPDGTTVALCGTLGAGKTRLVQADRRSRRRRSPRRLSPTFVLIQEYHGRRADLSHRRLPPARRRRVPRAGAGRVFRQRRAGAGGVGRPRGILPAEGSPRNPHRSHRPAIAAIRSGCPSARSWRTRSIACSGGSAASRIDKTALRR